MGVHSRRCALAVWFPPLYSGEGYQSVEVLSAWRILSGDVRTG